MLVLFPCVILYHVIYQSFVYLVYLVDIWVVSRLGYSEECCHGYSYTCLLIYRIMNFYCLCS